MMSSPRQRPLKKRKFNFPFSPFSEAAALALVGALVLALLMLPPMVGLANNGDFERVMHWGKFEYLTTDYFDKHFGWVNREFRITRSPLLTWWGYGSSEAIFVKLSALLGSLLIPGRLFDIRLLGVIHVLAFLLSLWTLMKGWQASTGSPPLLLIPIFALIFCDIGYLAYFHSFYCEPATLIFLLLTVGTGLYLAGQEKKQTWMLVVFFLSALCFVSAKLQNVPLVLPLLLFSGRLFSLRPEAAWRKTVVALSALLVSGSVFLYALTPRNMKDANKFNGTFNGILKDSPSPRQDLQELGLDEQYAVLAGTVFFNPHPPLEIKSPEFREGFFNRMNHLKLIRFYLTHPGRFLSKLKVTAQKGYTLRPDDLGNFEKQAEMGFGTKARRWSLWSSFKQHSLPKSLWFLTTYLLLLAGLIFKDYWKAEETTSRVTLEFYLALLLMIPIAFVTPILGEGETDLEKHMFLFNALFDLSLLVLFGRLLGAVYRTVKTHTWRLGAKEHSFSVGV